MPRSSEPGAGACPRPYRAGLCHLYAKSPSALPPAPRITEQAAVLPGSAPRPHTSVSTGPTGPAAVCLVVTGRSILQVMTKDGVKVRGSLEVTALSMDELSFHLISLGSTHQKYCTLSYWKKKQSMSQPALALMTAGMILQRRKSISWPTTLFPEL